MNITPKEVILKLQSIESCVIFCHTDPDADTLGAALALARQLRARGKKAEVVVDGDVPRCYMYLDSMKEVLHDVPAGEHDAYIAVDTYRPEALGALANKFTSFTGRTYNIDHHEYNTEYARYNLVIKNSSCCELLTDLFRGAGWKPDTETAKLLILGLLTDSGRLTHADVTDKTYQDAGALQSCGADIREVYDNIYNKMSREMVKLQDTVMKRMKLMRGRRIAVITVTNADLESLGLDRSVTEGYEYLPLAKAQDAEVSVFLKEQEGGGHYRTFIKSRTADVSALNVRFAHMTGTEGRCIADIVNAVSDRL
ncbi:MAG: DHH family phosphoesterase [Clostridia bacterium]|nr:DHH family phosphoesterase [Clostridia bacterium]